MKMDLVFYTNYRCTHTPGLDVLRHLDTILTSVSDASVYK